MYVVTDVIDYFVHMILKLLLRRQLFGHINEVLLKRGVHCRQETEAIRCGSQGVTWHDVSTHHRNVVWSYPCWRFLWTNNLPPGGPECAFNWRCAAVVSKWSYSIVTHLSLVLVRNLSFLCEILYEFLQISESDKMLPSTRLQSMSMSNKPAFFFTGNDQLLLTVYKAVSYFWDHHRGPTSSLNNGF